MTEEGLMEEKEERMKWRAEMEAKEAGRRRAREERERSWAEEVEREERLAMMMKAVEKRMEEKLAGELQVAKLELERKWGLREKEWEKKLMEVTARPLGYPDPAKRSLLATGLPTGEKPLHRAISQQHLNSI